MKAIFSFTHLPFKHLFGHLTIGFLLIGSMAQAQEAFYIYRNDGDFNGFFYDEVVEMRQSKIGVDSVEYDKWVTQEVVLADTIYRIPLAAIDSISFIQPEIKFNPRVKFMEKEGLCPYYLGCGNTDTEFRFQNLPAHLVPQVGDVLIGLPTDSISDKYYDWDYFGSFSCVVEEVRPGEPWEGENLTIVYGRPVDKPSDVFEQYITVEEIGVDENNQILRRVAGCTPDGLPRKMKDGDTGDIKWFNFSGKITHGWTFTENSSIDLSADVSLVFKLRIAYELTWTKVFVKLTKDMNFSIQPSIGVAANMEWVGSPGKFLWMPELLAPAPCPILRVNPLPDVFLKVSGSIEGRFNLPKVQLGFGDELIINSNAWFPISYTIHPLPDKDKEADANIFDVSSGLKMSGALQMGIEFQAIIGTASWIKKIINADVGLHLYTGPKLSGEISYDSKVTAASHAYWMLSNGHVDLSLLALDLEAGATAGIGWSDPEEIKFYEKSWDFMTSTVRLAPTFKNSEAFATPKNLVARIYPNSDYQLFARKVQIGLFDKDITDTTMNQLPIATTAEKSIYTSYLDTMYEGRFPVDSLKARPYHIYPMVDCGALGAYTVASAGTQVVPLTTFELQNNEIHFNAAGNNKPSITFTSNVADWELIYCRYEGDANHYIRSHKLDTVDLKKGIYKMTFEGYPCEQLWEMPPISKDSDDMDPMIEISCSYHCDTCPLWIDKHFGVSQDVAPLTNMRVSVGASSYFYTTQYPTDNQYITASYDGPVTATRVGENVIEISGETTSGVDRMTISMTLTNNRNEDTGFNDEYTVTGYITHKNNYPHLYGWFATATFSGVGRNRTITGTVTNATYKTVVSVKEDGSPFYEEVYHFREGLGAGGSLTWDRIDVLVDE